MSTFRRKYTTQRIKVQMKLLMNWRKGIKEMANVLTSVWKIDPSMSIGILGIRLISSIMPLIAIYQTKQIIDAFTVHPSTFQQIIVMMGILAASLLFATASQLVGDHITTRFQLKVADHFSFQVIEKAGRVSYPYYEDPHFHKTLHLAQQQALYRTAQLIPALNGTISSLISVFLLCAFFITLHSYFFLILMFFAIPAAIHKWMLAKKATDLEFKLVNKEREAGYIFQLLTGFQYAKELRVYGFGHNFLQTFKAIRSWIVDEKNKLQSISLKKNILAEALEILVFSTALTYLARSAYQKEITIGFFIIYLQGIQRLQTVSTTFFQSFLQVFQLRIFFRDLFAFLKIKDPEIEASTLTSFPQNLHSLEIKNLSFHYPGKADNTLQDINIKAKKGEVIAIVGENGSGKSTLVKLITGMYEANQGEIYFNDISSRNIPNQTLFENSAIFFQDFEKYFLKVNENIHFELLSTKVNHTSISDAAKKSGAHEFIDKLANGYDTRLGHIFQSREQLSGGEWQKLALSRIFYRQSQLVVLDEPSSALDAISEQTLYDNLKEHCKDKITILVSHRLYNLKMTDHIYVMENGMIKEHGKFDELINNGGVFEALYSRQKI